MKKSNQKKLCLDNIFFEIPFPFMLVWHNI